MYNLNNKIHRYWTQGENDTRVEYRFDYSVCKTCELMNKAERCIKTIKELASRFVAHKKYVGYATAIQYEGKDGVIYFNEYAADKFKRDIMKAIREAYK